ncbi:MAG: deoxyribonuclease V [Calditrichia bacterium]
MKIEQRHKWNVTTEEAREIQQTLRRKLETDIPIEMDKIKTIAAADISFSRFGKILFGAVVLMDFADLASLRIIRKTAEASFPYIPGYLSFREAPVIMDIFREIDPLPDVLLCDGHGVAHPRGFGLASHLGVLLDIPSIGCAKSVLVGEYEEPGAERGDYSPLVYHESIVGAALRTRQNVKPVFVSIGNKIGLEDAIRIVLHCSPRYRIPEPVRLAHREVNDLRRQSEKPKSIA